MDLTSWVTEAINGWLRDLARQLLGPALAALGQFLFQTPAFDQLPEIEAIWVVVRDIADALFVLAFLGVGILVMASGSLESRYSAKLLVPRLALAGVLANASLAVCGMLIALNNGLVQELLGSDPAAGALGELAGVVSGGSVLQQIIGVIVALAAAVLALLLAALYIGRDLVLLLLTVLAPLALATYALPQTDELARLWWRLYIALLYVQVVQAVLIRVGLQLLRHTNWLGGPLSDFTSVLLLATLLFALFKLPFAAYEFAFRQRFADGAAGRTVLVVARAARLPV
ncbi:MAG: hypothetical protein KGK34_01125 [Chloroflexota bacterium]|nr:hypothetical protein [Chloroflexota bacterium]